MVMKRKPNIRMKRKSGIGKVISHVQNDDDDDDDDNDENDTI